jgi:hypothetical protein
LTETGQTDYLKKLVVFMIALAVLATIVAMVWYFWAIVPIQKMEQQNPPSNKIGERCTHTTEECISKQYLYCQFTYGSDNWNAFWCRVAAPVGCWGYNFDHSCHG